LISVDDGESIDDLEMSATGCGVMLLVGTDHKGVETLFHMDFISFLEVAKVDFIFGRV
jgi:hypothetical protein